MATVTAAKNSKFYQITSTKTTVPALSLKTGTISTIGTQLIGVGTSFLSTLQKGDWIVDIVTNNEVRKVVAKFSDLVAQIDSPFSADIVAGAVFNVVRSRTKHIQISNSGSASATVDGTTMVQGETLTYGKAEKLPNGSDFIDPLIIDATSTTIDVSILK